MWARAVIVVRITQAVNDPERQARGLPTAFDTARSTTPFARARRRSGRPCDAGRPMIMETRIPRSAGDADALHKIVEARVAMEILE
jgi:hypothetical protein